jgi:hypothetical protein
MFRPAEPLRPKLFDAVKAPSTQRAYWHSAQAGSLHGAEAGMLPLKRAGDSIQTIDLPPNSMMKS